MNFIPVVENENVCINWGQISNYQADLYQNFTDICAIVNCPCSDIINCQDLNCKSSDHLKMLSTLYDCVITSLKAFKEMRVCW